MEGKICSGRPFWVSCVARIVCLKILSKRSPRLSKTGNIIDTQGLPDLQDDSSSDNWNNIEPKTAQKALKAEKFIKTTHYFIELLQNGENETVEDLERITWSDESMFRMKHPINPHKLSCSGRKQSWIFPTVGAQELGECDGVGSCARSKTDGTASNSTDADCRHRPPCQRTFWPWRSVNVTESTAILAQCASADFDVKKATRSLPFVSSAFPVLWPWRSIFSSNGPRIRIQHGRFYISRILERNQWSTLISNKNTTLTLWIQKWRRLLVFKPFGIFKTLLDIRHQRLYTTSITPCGRWTSERKRGVAE